MTKTRRDFTPEFKREAVALLESSGRPLMCPPSALMRQIGRVEEGRGSGSSESSPFEIGADAVGGYFKVSEECAKVAQLKLK